MVKKKSASNTLPFLLQTYVRDTGEVLSEISLPVFVFAFVAQFVFGIQLGWFRPTVGAGAPWPDLILPAIVLAGLNMAYVIRLTRAVTSESHSRCVSLAWVSGMKEGAKNANRGPSSPCVSSNHGC